MLRSSYAAPKHRTFRDPLPLSQKGHFAKASLTHFESLHIF